VSRWLLLWILVPGCTGLQERRAASQISRLAAATCGATWSVRDGDRSRTGAYAVSVFPEASRTIDHFPSERELAAYIAEERKLLERPDQGVGIWCHRASSGCHSSDPAPLACALDISRMMATFAEAARLARACNQQAIARLGSSQIETIDRDAAGGFGNGSALAGEELRRCIGARQ
jgi:hypothetical protein